MNRVKLGPEYFPGTNASRSLSNADIFVGEPSLDPEVPANQKTVSAQQEDGTVVPISQPINTGVGGIPLLNGSPVTLLVSGNYSLKVKDSVGSQIYNVPSVAYDLALGADKLSNYADFATALSEIGATIQELWVDQGVTLAAGASVQSTLTLRFMPGNTIDPNGFTLTINNPEQINATNRQQVFATATGVVFTEPGTIYANWWDDDIDDGSVVADTIFGFAVTAAVNGSKIIALPAVSFYNFTDELTINKSIDFESVTQEGADIRQATAGKGGIKVTASNVTIDNIKLTGPQKAAIDNAEYAIFCEGPDSSNYRNNITIKNCELTNWGRGGIGVKFVRIFKINDNYIHDNFRSGIETLSAERGEIKGNFVENIVADSVVGTLAYGITVTKNTGTAAVFPTSDDILIQGNIIRNIPTWEGLDTHGGHRISFIGNQLFDCRIGIVVGVFVATAGSESAPEHCVVADNIIVNDSVAATDVTHGIIITGNVATGVIGSNNTITGNTVAGYGDQDGSTAVSGAIKAHYNDSATIVGNTIRNSGRHALSIASCPNLICNSNSILTVTGTSADAATGTLIFPGIPSNGDTITLNTAVYTFVNPAAPATDFEIDIKGDLPLTLDEMLVVLNAASGPVTGLPTDGRVTLATYTEDGSDTLTITYDSVGRNGLGFTLAASVATASGANLTQGTTLGSAGIGLKKLSGGPATSGVISDNVINVGAYPAIVLEDDNIELDFYTNRKTGTGVLYDLKGTGAGGNSGAGQIDSIGAGNVASYDIPSIAAGNSYTIYLAANGLNNISPRIEVQLSRHLGGLTMTTQPAGNYFQLRLDNPSAGAINIASTNIFYWWGRFGQARN